MSGGENEGEATANVKPETEPILSHPDYKFDHKAKRYRHRATGQITSRADVEKAIEASNAAAAAKAKADEMSENSIKSACQNGTQRTQNSGSSCAKTRSR